MPSIRLAPIALCLACTSAGPASQAGSAGAPAPTPAVVQRVAGVGALEGATDPRFHVSMTVLHGEPADTVDASSAQLWRALPLAYGALGFQTILADSASGSVASPLLRIHRELGGVSLSRYLDCGRTSYGDNADVQEIVLRVRSTIEPVAGDATRAVVRTLVRAVASPQGSGGSSFQCGTTRGIENRIAASLRRLAPAS